MALEDEQVETVDFDTQVDEADDLRSEPDQSRIEEARYTDDNSGRFAISDGEEDEEFRRQGISARVLYIHGVREVAEKELHERFSKYGSIKALHIPVRPGTSISKGYGFVRMSTPEEATAAIDSEDGKNFLGVSIEVMRAKRPRLGAPSSPPRRRYQRSGGYDRFDRYAGPPRRDYPPRREYSPGPPMERGPARYHVRNEYPPSSRYPGPPPPRDLDDRRYYDRVSRYPVDDYVHGAHPSYPPYSGRNAPPLPPPPPSGYDYDRNRGGRSERYDRGYSTAPPPAGPNYYPAPSNYPPRGGAPPPRYRDDYPPNS